MEFTSIVKEIYHDNEIEYGIFNLESEITLLIKVGQNGSIYGYQDKYLNMANRVLSQFSINVVVSSNPYDRTDSLEQAVMIIHREIPKTKDILYMGVSNGAILGARFGYLHREISKMLLINGPLMINLPQTKKGAEKFQGKSITFVYGKLDPSYRYSEILSLIKSSSKIQLIYVDQADHNFKGMEEIFADLPILYLLQESDL